MKPSILFPLIAAVMHSALATSSQITDPTANSGVVDPALPSTPPSSPNETRANPKPSASPVFVALPDQSLYIYNKDAIEFYRLDLQKSWDVTKPAWSMLANGSDALLCRPNTAVEGDTEGHAGHDKEKVALESLAVVLTRPLNSTVSGRVYTKRDVDPQQAHPRNEQEESLILHGVPSDGSANAVAHQQALDPSQFKIVGFLTPPTMSSSSSSPSPTLAVYHPMDNIWSQVQTILQPGHTDPLSYPSASPPHRGGRESKDRDFEKVPMSDPESGLIYLPLTVQESNEHHPLPTMDVLDAKSFIWLETEVNAGGVGGTDEEKKKALEKEMVRRSGYSNAVWSMDQRAFYVFGGVQDDSDQQQQTRMVAALARFDPRAKNWTIVQASGDIPQARVGSCLATAYNGTKLILFGGLYRSDNKDTNPSNDVKNNSSSTNTTNNSTTSGPLVLNDIHIMDLTSSTWKKGPTLNATQARHGAVCATAGDMFVAWGGSQTGISRSVLWSRPITDVEPVVYNIKSNKWVDRFDPAQAGSGGGSGGRQGGEAGQGGAKGGAAGLVMRPLPTVVAMMATLTAMVCAIAVLLA